MNQVIQIIFYVGLVQGVLLSIFLFSLKANVISNRLLGLLSLFWGIVIGFFAFQFEGLHYNYPHLMKVSYVFLFCLFPLLYLQVKYLVSDYSKFALKDLLHFLPLLFVVLLNIDFYFKSSEEKLNIIIDQPRYYYIVLFIQNEILALQGIIYSILALKLLSRYRKRIRDYQSNIDKSIIKVQYTGIYLSLFAWIIGTVGAHVELLNVGLKLDLFIFVYLILVIIIYIISYTAINSPEIFKIEAHQIGVSLIKTKITDSVELNKSDNVQNLSIDQDKLDQIEEVNDKLLLYVENEKPYLNPELSLQELADSIEEKRYFLSIVINHKHQQNFYEFINRYRIEEVKTMLADPKNKHLKLISIALDAGFNSKASFYRTFKQMTNMTPSQFLDKQVSNESPSTLVNEE